MLVVCLHVSMWGWRDGEIFLICYKSAPAFSSGFNVLCLRILYPVVHAVPVRDLGELFRHCSSKSVPLRLYMPEEDP